MDKVSITKIDEDEIGTPTFVVSYTGGIGMPKLTAEQAELVVKTYEMIVELYKQDKTG